MRYSAAVLREPQPMWVIDTETERFLLVNDAACTKYGYSPEEFAGCGFGSPRDAANGPSISGRPDPEVGPCTPATAARRPDQSTWRWPPGRRTSRAVRRSSRSFNDVTEPQPAPEGVCARSVARPADGEGQPGALHRATRARGRPVTRRRPSPPPSSSTGPLQDGQRQPRLHGRRRRAPGCRSPARGHPPSRPTRRPAER